MPAICLFMSVQGPWPVTIIAVLGGALQAALEAVARQVVVDHVPEE